MTFDVAATTEKYQTALTLKCGNTQCDTGQMRAAGGFWSKIFDVQGRKFTSVTCTNCRYTEFYRAESSKLGSLFDLFTN